MIKCHQNLKCSGIYQIVNLTNFKSYIGSSKFIYNRWNHQHFRSLKLNIHHNQYLQHAWNKYGEDSFLIIVLEYISNNPTELLKAEQEWINLLNPTYNIGSVGGGDNFSKNPNKENFVLELKARLKHKIESMTQEEIKLFYSRGSGHNNPNWKGGKDRFKCQFCNKQIAYNSQKWTCLSCSKKKRVKIHDIIYNSIADAAEALNIIPITVTRRIKRNDPGYEFFT